MLKISVKSPNGQEETVFDLSTEYNDILYKLTQYDTGFSPFSLRVKYMRDKNTQIRMYADSDAGKALLALFNTIDPLYDVYILDRTIYDLNEEIKAKIEQNLLHDSYKNTDEIYDDIKAIMKSDANTKESFYCPLTGNMDINEYCNVETANETLIENSDVIEEELALQQADEVYMAEYLNKGSNLGGKLVFAEWCVEKIQGSLYGRIDCYLTGSLTEEETARLKNAILRQNREGLGADFALEEFATEDGDLYVSFWHEGNDYFIYTENEMETYLSQRRPDENREIISDCNEETLEQTGGMIL